MRFLLISLLLVSINAFAGKFVICENGQCVIPTTGEEWVESNAKDGFYYLYEPDDESGLMFEDMKGLCHGNGTTCYTWSEMDRKTGSQVDDD